MLILTGNMIQYEFHKWPLEEVALFYISRPLGKALLTFIKNKSSLANYQGKQQHPGFTLKFSTAAQKRASKLASQPEL